LFLLKIFLRRFSRKIGRKIGNGGTGIGYNNSHIILFIHDMFLLSDESIENKISRFQFPNESILLNREPISLVSSSVFEQSDEECESMIRISEGFNE